MSLWDQLWPHLLGAVIGTSAGLLTSKLLGWW